LTSDRPVTGAVRRATDADRAGVAALVPGLVPAMTQDHATFVVDGPAGVAAVLDLAQAVDHLTVEHLHAPDAETAARLMRFAEAAARALGAGELRLKPGSGADRLAAALGFRQGVKRMGEGRLARFNDRLDSVGVPLWRDGWASFSQSLYFRGVWAAMALLVGLGSISAAALTGNELTWVHIFLPGLLCAAGTLFALWQIVLIVAAARRSTRLVWAATAGAACGAIILIGLAIWDRAVPSLSELWDIYAGDTRIGDVEVATSADGRTLRVEGPYGMHSDEAVRRALAQSPSIREVVLAGPGGRIAAGFELFRLFRQRKLATRVEDGCASACTIAFLGGVERSVGPEGKLGFHRVSFPGLSDSDMYESNRDLKRFLIYAARLTPEFAQRVVDTPAEGIWVPTNQELLAGKVITRVNP